MKHFLITRFNIKNEVWLQTKSGTLTNTNEWLEQRFRLFETYCLPSVKNQNNQEFKWLVLFDSNTPIFFKNKIESLSETYSNMIVLYTESFKTLKATLSEAISSELSTEDNYIITTRLDNDDAIHREFTNCIQQLFTPKHKTIIDVVKGYQFIINHHNNDVRQYTLKYNPFISLIEDVTKFETVMSKNHGHWKALANRIVINKKRLWMQVIHNDNILNHKINILKKVNRLDLNDFGLKLGKINNNYLLNFIFNLFTVPSRLFIVFKYKLKDFIK